MSSTGSAEPATNSDGTAWLDGRTDVIRRQLVDDATALFLAMGEAAAALASRRGGS